MLDGNPSRREAVTDDRGTAPAEASSTTAPSSSLPHVGIFEPPPSLLHDVGRRQPSPMVSFISAFLKRLSTGDSVESIKRDLNRRPPSNAFVGTAFSATVSKCPNLESEYPCYFDLSGSASAAATRISGSPRSADATACSCCHHDPSPGEANTGEMTACMEGPEAGRPATFESFSWAHNLREVAILYRGSSEERNYLIT